MPKENLCCLQCRFPGPLSGIVRVPPSKVRTPFGAIICSHYYTLCRPVHLSERGVVSLPDQGSATKRLLCQQGALFHPSWTIVGRLATRVQPVFVRIGTHPSTTLHDSGRVERQSSSASTCFSYFTSRVSAITLTFREVRGLTKFSRILVLWNWHSVRSRFASRRRITPFAVRSSSRRRRGAYANHVALTHAGARGPFYK